MKRFKTVKMNYYNQIKSNKLAIFISNILKMTNINKSNLKKYNKKRTSSRLLKWIKKVKINLRKWNRLIIRKYSILVKMD